MFKKLEAWLRRIIAEEVKKVEVTLETERTILTSAVSIHARCATNGVEAEVTKLVGEFEQKLRADAASILVEKNQLIAELKTRLEEMQQTVSKFTTWKASDETVAADHVLRKVK